MVGIGDSGHGVNFKVFVRSDRGCLLDRSPVRERGLCVVEPLVAELLHVGGIQMGHPLRNLRSRYPPVEV